MLEESSTVGVHEIFRSSNPKVGKEAIDVQEDRMSGLERKVHLMSC